MPVNGQQINNPDMVIAFDMLKDSKFFLSGLAKAAAEATNPQLRQFVNKALSIAVQEHFRLSDTMITNGWYQPMNINNQLQIDLSMAQQINQQMNQAPPQSRL